jgi:uncharacterized protein (TIGR03067 family)
MAEFRKSIGATMLVAVLSGTVLADIETKIEGRWTIASVEFAGTPVGDFAGAQVDFANGEKTLTLPDGTVEKGTYRLDAAHRGGQLGEIDSTTEGRDEAEQGIYLLDGDTLKLCIATRGGARPREFATKSGTDQLLIVLRRAASNPTGNHSATIGVREKEESKKLSGSRGFRMGFTGFVYDFTPEAIEASRTFVRENGDIVCHHIEGVPWAEALHNRPFPKTLLEEWEGKKAATPPGGKVYLAISPGRGELKVADKASNILPDELKNKGYNAPLVMQAYLNYCHRAIDFFEPDYLAIGIEVNEIHDLGPQAWQAYVALHQHVYGQLKQGHAEMPVFASWTLHNMFKKRGAMLADWKKLMPYNDVVAVSYYPFMVADSDRLPALDWMTAQFDEFQKPYAIVETNDAAERLPLPAAKVVIEGTPQKQEMYYQRLLRLAQERNFEFVISFIHQDYDALWDKIKLFSPELFIAWKDCGLLDEQGNARPAFQVWTAYFDLPLER